MSDKLKNTTRNLIFLALIAIILACLYGVYFDLSVSNRNEPVYLSLFIVSNLFFGGVLILSMVDSFRNRDLKMDNESFRKKKEEFRRINDRFPQGSKEIPGHLIGKEHDYHHNAFEKTGNVWRTVVYAVVALTIFTSFIITYLKIPADIRDNAGYIIAVVVASLAMSSHLGMLIYQIYEVSKLDKTKSVPNIMKYQRIDPSSNYNDDEF
jgi:hypothetical protein